MRRTIGTVRLACAVALVAAATPSWAQPRARPTEAMDGAWHFTIAPYMWATGISGSASVANLPEVPVDLSFSDIIGDLDFAALGYVEGRKDRIGIALDIMYVNLGPFVETDAPVIGRLTLKADVRSTIAEGFLSAGWRAVAAATTPPLSTSSPAPGTRTTAPGSPRRPTPGSRTTGSSRTSAGGMPWPA